MIADRHVWAVETMEIDPTDHILEVRPGHGVTASLVCERLTTGTITAIDSSARMIEMATKRNSGCIAAGTAVFKTVASTNAEFGDQRFDKIFAFHVRSFWTPPYQDLAFARELLVPGGKLHLFAQPMAPKQAEEFARSIPILLRERGFTVDVVTDELESGPIVCVIGTQPGNSPA